MAKVQLTKRYQVMATSPHSGEQIPPEAEWLKNWDELTLMGDVDRYVDQLYESSLDRLKIPFLKTEWHRYALDLNRLPTDVDTDSVEGAPLPSGSYPRGFHWAFSTKGIKLLTKPLSRITHQALIDRVYVPFHRDLKQMADQLLQVGPLLHLDLHSMPSLGTYQHRDPGERRKSVVISDSKGKSCDPLLKDFVIAVFEEEGFEVAYNWPYFGGRLTEAYGQPSKNHHVIQIELNRALYMDEVTKKKTEGFEKLSQRLDRVLEKIHQGVNQSVNERVAE